MRDVAARALGTIAADKAAAARLGMSLPSTGTLTSSELVARLDSLDVGPLRAAGIPPIAVFDFDNTLMRGDVLFDFIELVLAQKVLPQSTAAKLRATYEGHLRGDIDGATFFLDTAASLRGVSDVKLHALVEELYERGAPGRGPYTQRALGHGTSLATSRELIAKLEEKGVRCYIITAGLTILARAGARVLGVSPANVYGGDLGFRGRFCTGQTTDVAQLGKDTLVRRDIGVPPLFAFGDSAHTDAPMLPLALVRGFMVDPPRAFIEHTARHGHTHLTLTYKPAVA